MDRPWFCIAKRKDQGRIRLDQRRFGLVKRKDQRLIGLDQVWEGFRLESDVAKLVFAYPKLSKTGL